MFVCAPQRAERVGQRPSTPCGPEHRTDRTRPTQTLNLGMAVGETARNHGRLTMSGTTSQSMFLFSGLHRNQSPLPRTSRASVGPEPGGSEHVSERISRTQRCPTERLRSSSVQVKLDPASCPQTQVKFRSSSGRIRRLYDPNPSFDGGNGAVKVEVCPSQQGV